MWGYLQRSELHGLRLARALIAGGPGGQNGILVKGADAVGPQRYHVVYAHHGTVNAVLACNEAPDGTTWVNIFVASSPGDYDTTRHDAQSLLDRMEGLARKRREPDRR